MPQLYNGTGLNYFQINMYENQVNKSIQHQITGIVIRVLVKER